VTDTIRPGAVRWEQALKRDLFYGADMDACCAEFNLDGLMRGDMVSRYRGYAVGRQWGWLSVNDVRSKESMNKVENGDVYLTPLNMVEAGKDTETLLNEKTN
jgi:phage portal protein BeeE